MMIFALLSVLGVPVYAGPDGHISVVDGDTIDVGGTRVRLFGIDAPEGDQTCTRPEGAVWACGTWATAQVRALYQGKRARCKTIERDHYGRAVARCTVRGQDMGATIVDRGFATAFLRYSDLYAEIEKGAVVAGRGIFGSDMAPPEAHRSAARAPQQAAPGRCVIKGNISDNGRIYHLPGQEHYARTRISENRGERWFCSEADARAAGWRRARR
ncbi:MAG: thermonuclease family protein [Rhodobacteraceae bacterium]|nr:thermonuclease family protein [Paracoccaceae bacterium]